jgi:hypothetical protein
VRNAQEEEAAMQWLRRRASLAWGFLLALGLHASSAHAEQAVPVDQNPRRSRSEAEPHYLRAALELSGLLVLGSLQYGSVSSNVDDWDLGYDWESFRKKLTGEAVRFDTNRFDTNVLSHPAAGTLYYIAARGNHLSILESSLMTAAASTLWEYVGEFKEMASVNDLIITPVSGIAIGESFTQVGIFFQRSKPTLVTKVLAAVFAPSQVIHDGIDGTAPSRAEDLDRFGLPRDTPHRFELIAGVGRPDGGSRYESGAVTDVGSGPRDPSETDLYFALRMKVLNVPGGDQRDSGATWLSDGNAAWIRAEGAASSAGIHDLQLDAISAPVGYYMHSLAVPKEHRLFVGTTVGFDYALHRYASAGGVFDDRISGVHAAGITLEFEGPLGRGGRIRSGLMLKPEFAAVQSLALPKYLAMGNAPAAISTVAREQSYYFALGAGTAPTLELSWGPIAVGAEARLDWYTGIQGLDRHQEDIHNPVSLRDQRTLGRAWLAYEPVNGVVVQLIGERRLRSGSVGPVNAERAETTFATAVGVLVR